MASVWRHPKSRFYTACFTDKNGARKKRSTKESDRKKALKIAEEFETISRGRKTITQVRRVVAEITRDIMGRELESLGLKDFIKQWVASRKGEVKPATHTFYQAKSKRFIDYMAKRGRGDCSLLEVTREDVLSWRNEEATRVSAKTVNHGLKLLRMIFSQARADELIADDPTESVKVLSTGNSKISRRPFSQDELAVVFRNCNLEWYSMVMFGLYTSHRLSDIAMLRWCDLDIEQRLVRFVTRKSGAVAVVPMHDDLYEHVLSLSTPDDPNAPVHHHAYAETERGRSPQLSNAFAEILVKAGLRKKGWRQGNKDGAKGGRRVGSELSFHSLRHTFISELQRAGVSAPIAGEMAGHKSTAMTRIYTHIDHETKRDAISKLPAMRRTRDDGQMELPMS
jgi:integrase